VKEKGFGNDCDKSKVTLWYLHKRNDKKHEKLSHHRK
jgi:hypothetical protein